MRSSLDGRSPFFLAMVAGGFTVLAFSAGIRADEPLLAPGDFILAIDEDLVSESSYPTGGNDEKPANILDGSTATKYLNFGKENSGIIVTPNFGASTIHSFVVSTANDSSERDPVSFELYGTNDGVASTNNSTGTGENWTLIASGALALPTDRMVAGPVITFTNTTAYTAYKMLFPTLRDAVTANSMQISEIALYESADATGTNILAAGGKVLAIDADGGSAYPVPSESPPAILDGAVSSKYLNFGKENSGFIVTQSSGAAAAQSMLIYTANDAVERDPTSYEIYGSKDAIASLDNSTGTAEAWTLISSGALTLPLTRFAAGTLVSFTNTTAYTSYKVLFPTLRDTGLANSMQIAEVALFPAMDGTGTNILSAGGTVLAVDADGYSESAYDATSSPPDAIDGTVNLKYANTGKAHSGFIVTPSVGLSIVTSFKITTGDLAVADDPTSWVLYGTTSPIASTDNSAGMAEAWTEIASGTIALPTDRFTEGPVVTFTNTTMYSSYKMVFPSIVDAVNGGAMDIGEIQFYGTMASAIPDQLLSPGDFIIAFDLDPDTNYSNYPSGENPANALDGNANTKYLNFGRENSGLIVTPAAGATVVQSLRLTTANDATERDPASFELYGTNAAIVTANNGIGNEEPWTLITSGALSLPDTRFDATTVVTFSNGTAYTSYKVVFPTVKNVGAANSMQIADVALYASNDGSGTNVLATSTAILAIDSDIVPSSSYPPEESPAKAIDRVITNTTGGASKYLNNGKTNAGFIVRPSVGATTVSSFKFVTANDYTERDPAGWALYGTNDTIVDVDNGHGDLENWTLIASGTMQLPDARFASGPMVTFDNLKDYTAYRMVITSLKNEALADSFQFAEVQFYGKIGVACGTPFADLDGDKDVDMNDFGVFQTCFTGVGGLATSHTCRCLDRGKDGAVEAVDLVQFLNCWTGPSVTWQPELTPGCVP